MGVVQLVCIGDKLFVEPLLAGSQLISAYQYDCGPRWIERESNTKDLIRGVGTQLFHVGMLRPLQRTCIRTTQLRAKQLEQVHFGDDLRLGSSAEFREPHIENAGR